MISQDDEKIVKEALLYFENADSGIVFVEVNEPVRQNEIVECIIKDRSGPKKILVVDLKDLSSDKTHLDEVKNKISENPEVEIVLILNLHTLAGGSETKELGLVRDLNFSREPYTKLNKLLVFFLPSYFVDLVARHARDFLDFVSMDFKFRPERSYAFEEMDSESDMADERFIRNRIAFLESALQTYSFTDSERADKLFDIAKNYNRFYSGDKALSYYAEGLELAKKLENKKLQGLILNNISQIYVARGDDDTALTYLQQSLKISQDIDDKEGEGTTLNNISQIYRARGDYDSALNYLKQSLKIFQEIGNRTGEGATLNNIGLIYHDRGDYEAALNYLQQSLKIRQEIGDRGGEGTTLNNISQIYVARGDDDTALSYLQKSLKIRQETGDRRGEGATLNNISQIYHARGAYDAALSYLKHSLQIQQDIGDKRGKIPTLHNMAMIAFQMKDEKKYFDYETAAYKLAIEIGDSMALYKVGRELGVSLIESGRKKEGIEILKRSLEVGRRANFSDVHKVEAVLHKFEEKGIKKKAKKKKHRR